MVGSIYQTLIAFTKLLLVCDIMKNHKNEKCDFLKIFFLRIFFGKLEYIQHYYWLRNTLRC